jgi:hypothetical protein
MDMPATPWYMLYLVLGGGLQKLADNVPTTEIAMLIRNRKTKREYMNDERR